MAALEGLPERDLKQVVGNGIHTAAFAAFFIFIMGNVVRRDKDIAPMIGNPTHADSNPDDDAPADKRGNEGAGDEVTDDKVLDDETEDK